MPRKIKIWSKWVKTTNINYIFNKNRSGGLKSSLSCAKKHIIKYIVR